MNYCTIVGVSIRRDSIAIFLEVNLINGLLIILLVSAAINLPSTCIIVRKYMLCYIGMYYMNVLISIQKITFVLIRYDITSLILKHY